MATDFPAAILFSGGNVTANSPATSCVQLSALTALQDGQFLSLPTAIQINILGTSCAYGSGEAAGTSPRIDLVCIQYTTADTNLAVRQFIDPATNTTTSETIATDQVDSFAIQVVHGTPASSPVAPAIPAGWWGLAQVYVPANATTIASSNITDTSSGYRTDGGHLALTSQGLLQWVNASTVGMPSGSTLAIGPTTLTDNSGTLTVGSGTQVLSQIPVQLDYVGTQLILKPQTNPATNTTVFTVQTANGTPVTTLDNAGNFVTTHGTFNSGVTINSSLAGLVCGLRINWVPA